MNDNTYTDHSGSYFVVFFFWLLFSLVAATIARNKGNSGLVAFLFSVTFSPFVGILLAVIKKRNDEALDLRQIATGKSKKCPNCAEIIKAEASTCRYCGRDLNSLSHQNLGNDLPTPRIAPKIVSLPTPRIVKPKLKIAKDGAEYAELNVDEIGALIHSGHLSMDDYYFDQKSNDWIALRQHPQIVV